VRPGKKERFLKKGWSMGDKDSKNPVTELVRLAMDSLDLAVSIIDPQGTLLYYNRQAAKLLDRQPAYLGGDIHLHHQQAATNQRLDAMLREFMAGRTEPFHYEARPYGETILVTFLPLRKDGQFLGCLHSVRPKKD
jgi:PAS domain-containing protein